MGQAEVSHSQVSLKAGVFMAEGFERKRNAQTRINFSQATTEEPGEWNSTFCPRNQWEGKG